MTGPSAPQKAVQVFLDIGLCPEGLRADRTLGDPSAICTNATPLGRVTLGAELAVAYAVCCIIARD